MTAQPIRPGFDIDDLSKVVPTEGQANIGVVFMEPPAPQGAPWGRHHTIAAALRGRPGEWARIQHNGPNSHRVKYIRQALSRAYAPAGAFQATYRRNADGTFDIYARYVGDTK